MESTTNNIIARFSDAFRADRWTVQLKNRLTDEAFRVSYSQSQLISALAFLRWKNREGFDIYARPIGWQYILLDDLTKDVIGDLAELKPCSLLETSPANYQAWLILSDVPADRDIAISTCRELAKRFGADPASADPDHVGRLPGYTNRKQKHQLSNGQYPYVRLHRSEYRLSTFYPSGAAVLEGTKPTHIFSRKAGRSESEKDFGIACGLLRKGLSDEQICTYLLTHSPDLEGRKGKKYLREYLEKTIRNAHRVI